jgi:hypothetical protein
VKRPRLAAATNDDRRAGDRTLRSDTAFWSEQRGSSLRDVHRLIGAQPRPVWRATSASPSLPIAARPIESTNAGGAGKTERSLRPPGRPTPASVSLSIVRRVGALERATAGDAADDAADRRAGNGGIDDVGHLVLRRQVRPERLIERGQGPGLHRSDRGAAEAARQDAGQELALSTAQSAAQEPGLN